MPVVCSCFQLAYYWTGSACVRYQIDYSGPICVNKACVCMATQKSHALSMRLATSRGRSLRFAPIRSPRKR